MSELWKRLSHLHHQVSVLNCVDRLLEHGATGMDILQGLAHVHRRILGPSEYQDFYLPWYHPSDLGAGAWWTGSEPLKVKHWMNAWQTGGGEHRGTIALLADLPEKALERLGESLAAEDTSLGVTMIVDGSKRACAAFSQGRRHAFLVLSSPYAHMLYPLDFMYHVRRFAMEVT